MASTLCSSFSLAIPGGAKHKKMQILISQARCIIFFIQYSLQIDGFNARQE
jgi:hypothetical protein